MRLINAENLLRDIIETYEYEFPTASGGFDEFVTNILPNIIKNQPTIDAVPVVRCKDCMYWWSSAKVCTNPSCYDLDFRYSEEDDYCSHGERCDTIS